MSLLVHPSSQTKFSAPFIAHVAKSQQTTSNALSTTETYLYPQPVTPQQPPTQPTTSFSSYFSVIKKQIQNKQLQNQEQTLKNIVNIFVNECEKSTDPIIKVIIACINVICLIMHHKKPIRKESIKYVANIKFIGCLLRFDVKKILNQNKNIQSSLCYLLQLCYEHRLFDQPRAKGLISLYKKFALGLFRQISDSPKVVFNTFKIMQFLQISNQLQPNDYIKHDILQIIGEKTLNCKGDNMIIYELAYKLMLNGDGCDEAFNLFNRLSSNCKKGSSSIFFTSLTNSSQIISQSLFNQLLQQQLIQGQQRLQSSFCSLLRRHISSMGVMSFLGLLQSHFLQHFCSKWNEVVVDNQVVDFVSVLVGIQQKSKEYMLYETVRDKIFVLMPFLVIERRREEGEGQPSISSEPQ